MSESLKQIWYEKGLLTYLNSKGYVNEFSKRHVEEGFYKQNIPFVVCIDKKHYAKASMLYEAQGITTFEELKKMIESLEKEDERK